MTERDPRQIEMFPEEEMGHSFPGPNAQSLAQKLFSSEQPFSYPGERPLFSPKDK